MIGRLRVLGGVAVSVGLAAACSAPGGGASPGASPAPGDAGAPPLSAQVVGVLSTPTPPLFGAAPQNAAAVAPSAGTAQGAPLVPVAPAQPAPPDLSNAVTAPPRPTLLPGAAAAATANAATAIAGATRVAATATAQPAQQVLLQNFAIAPQTVTVQPGTNVIFRNLDAAPHQLSGSDFDSGRIVSGEYWAAQFQRPGTYDYVCVFHPTMKGKIVVSASSSALQLGS